MMIYQHSFSKTFNDTHGMKNQNHKEILEKEDQFSYFRISQIFQFETPNCFERHTEFRRFHALFFSLGSSSPFSLPFDAIYYVEMIFLCAFQSMLPSTEHKVSRKSPIADRCERRLRLSAADNGQHARKSRLYVVRPPRSVSVVVRTSRR
jgi:hypothetical protein